MFEISKDFAWSSSHVLAGLPPDHQCARLHGHNYTARVILSSDTLDATGFVVDYGRLAPVKQWIDTRWDHRHLNDIVDGNPTAERLARELAGVVADLLPDLSGHVAISVGISETPKTWAVYR